MEQMTLRDEIAIKVLPIICNEMMLTGTSCLTIASKCYNMADAMLKVRADTQPTVSDNSDGWINWSGGECPVAPSTYVEVKFADGGVYIDKAGSLRWYHHRGIHHGDIVAYRKLKK